MLKMKRTGLSDSNSRPVLFILEDRQRHSSDSAFTNSNHLLAKLSVAFLFRGCPRSRWQRSKFLVCTGSTDSIGTYHCNVLGQTDRSASHWCHKQKVVRDKDGILEIQYIDENGEKGASSFGDYTPKSIGPYWHHSSKRSPSPSAESNVYGWAICVSSVIMKWK